jgi:hypothetical protein
MAILRIVRAAITALCSCIMKPDALDGNVV